MALDFGAGCLGGCAGVLVGHPFDTVKVHLQTQDFKNPMYRGTFDCFRKIIARESITGLYKGMSSPIAGIAVVNAIVFGVYGNVQRHMSNPNGLAAHTVAGLMAGLTQSIISSPLELAKTRIQIQKGANTFSNPMQCLAHVAKTEGVRGVFRGLTITAVRDAPGLASYFVSYELLTRSSEGNVSTIRTLLAGGGAGIISWIVCYPIDVVKSRLQTDGMYGPRKYANAMDCVRQSVRDEGWKVMTRGMNSTLLRAFPTNAATFAVVNWCFRTFSNPSADITIQPAEDVLSLHVSVSAPVHEENSLLKRWGRGLYTWCERNLPTPIQHKKCATYKSLYFLGAFHEAVCCSEIAEITGSCCDEDEYAPDVSYFVTENPDIIGTSTLTEETEIHDR